MTPAIQRLASFMPKSPKEMSRVQKRMAQAGYHGLTPVLVYTASEFITPVISGGIIFLVVHGPAKIALTILAGMIGYVVPGMVLRRLTNQRKKVIQNGLPTRSICSSCASRPARPLIRRCSRPARTSTCRIRPWLRNCG